MSKEKYAFELSEETAKPGKIGLALDKVFHYYERGSTMKQEVYAGISMFVLSVCALFMNITVLTGAFDTQQPYLGVYLGATLISFIGTLLIGILTNMPLAQCASLSLSSVMISMLGANTGLTYENLLAVTFVSAVIYAAAMLIPGVRTAVYKALPRSVRKALPAAVGLYIAYLSLEQIGFFEAISSTEVVMREEYVNYCILLGVIGIVITAVLKFNGAKHPYLKGFFWSTLLFYLIACFTGTTGAIFSAIYSVNRIYVGINPDPNGEMYFITSGLSQVKFGQVFSSGFDFSQYTAAGGNVVKLFAQGILIFFFMGMYETEAAADAAAQNRMEEETEKKQKILLLNAVTNVLAPIFYVAPVSVAKESAAASEDGGKTGLTSIVCAIGYFIAMFTWAIFIFFATEVPVVPEYGHAGYLFPAVVNSSFQIASAVMFVVGVSMLKAFKNCDFTNAAEFAAFTMTVAVTFVAQNIVYGAAFGVIGYVLIKALSFKKEEWKDLNAGNIVLCVLMVILLAVSLL